MTRLFSVVTPNNVEYIVLADSKEDVIAKLKATSRLRLTKGYIENSTIEPYSSDVVFVGCV
jgi:hypothetical protein